MKRVEAYLLDEQHVILCWRSRWWIVDIGHSDTTACESTVTVWCEDDTDQDTEE